MCMGNENDQLTTRALPDAFRDITADDGMYVSMLDIIVHLPVPPCGEGVHEPS